MILMGSAGGDTAKLISDRRVSKFCRPMLSVLRMIYGNNAGSFSGEFLDVSEKNACLEGHQEKLNDSSVNEGGSGMLLGNSERKEESEIFVLGGGKVQLHDFEHGASVRVLNKGNEETCFDSTCLCSTRCPGEEAKPGSYRNGAALLSDQKRNSNVGGDVIFGSSEPVVDCMSSDISSIDVLEEKNGVLSGSLSSNCETNLSAGSCVSSICREDEQSVTPASGMVSFPPDTIKLSSCFDAVKDDEKRDMSPQISSYSVAKTSSSLYPSDISSVVVDLFLDPIAPFVQEATGIITVCSTSICKDADCQHITRGIKKTSRSHDLLFRRSNPKRAASLNSRCKNGKSTAAQKSMETSASLPNISMKIVACMTRRKRTSPTKSRRTSMWGAPESIKEIFEQHKGFTYKDSDPLGFLNKKIGKRRSVLTRMLQTRKKDISLRASKCNSTTPHFSWCRNDSKFMQYSFPQVANLLGKKDYPINTGFSVIDVDSQNKSAEYMYDVRHHIDKDMESSVTQEASVVNQQSDFPGGSSQIICETSIIADRQSLDSGMSPESDVLHPSVDASVNECAGVFLTAQTSGTDQNIEDLDLAGYNGVHSSDCASSEFPFPASASLLDKDNHAIPLRTKTGDCNAEASQLKFNEDISKEKCMRQNYGRRDLGDEVTPLEPSKSSEGHHALPQAARTSRPAWVSCDDCQKWRRISVELADNINKTKCKWTCKDNEDQAFACCSIPQEMTDDEINKELQISDDEDVCDAKTSLEGSNPLNVGAFEVESWKLIRSNLFLRRNRKPQSIDEVMVCNCKPPSNGNLGCGEECFNRMVNVECVKGTCPSGDRCSNQQFQKRRYAKFKKIHCGRKGYGLQLQEHVKKGQFLIEYVGEVLDLASYAARQREYASRGQKHFYFMTLSGGEVIDACAKGNLGRFINHSCDPNCETQKWMVNGEMCVGLFALRDIKKGEEVTFNYNYERVFGAAARKCICGSFRCRGYIGGSPSNNEVVAQDDSDEEHNNPAVVNKNMEGIMDGNAPLLETDNRVGSREGIYVQSLIRNKDVFPPTAVFVCRDSLAVTESDSSSKSEDVTSITLSAASPSAITLKIPDCSPRKPYPSLAIECMENSGHSLSTSQASLSYCKLPSATQGKSHAVINRSEFCHEHKDFHLSVTKNKQSRPETCQPEEVSQSNNNIKRPKSSPRSIVPHEIDKEFATASNGYPDLVDGALNKLFDEGGIHGHKVHKDARNFKDELFPYVVPRAAISDRDDVLSDFSLNSSQYSYREHSHVLSEKSCEASVSAHEENHTEPWHEDCFLVESPLPNSQPIQNSLLSTEGSSDGVHCRKRKTRSNDPSENTCSDSHPSAFSSVEQNFGKRSKSTNPTMLLESQNSNLIRETCEDASRMIHTDKKDLELQDSDDDGPPGFNAPPGFESFHQDCKPKLTSNISTDRNDVVMGQLQERYLSHLPVSYGIPMEAVRRVGIPRTNESSSIVWFTAPSIPFRPFPPLPSETRDSLHSTSADQSNRFRGRMQLLLDEESINSQCMDNYLN